MHGHRDREQARQQEKVDRGGEQHAARPGARVRQRLRQVHDVPEQKPVLRQVPVPQPQEETHDRVGRAAWPLFRRPPPNRDRTEAEKATRAHQQGLRQRANRGVSQEQRPACVIE